MRRRLETSSAFSRSATGSRQRKTNGARRRRRRPNGWTQCRSPSRRVGEEGKLFGSVTAADIQQQLESQGFHIERRQIDLHEPIKALGVYRVPIRLHADVKPEVRVWVIKQ